MVLKKVDDIFSLNWTRDTLGFTLESTILNIHSSLPAEPFSHIAKRQQKAAVFGSMMKSILPPTLSTALSHGNEDTRGRSHLHSDHRRFWSLIAVG